MKFETKFKILLQKSYLDQGMGLTYYAKYFIGLFGLYSIALKIDIRVTILIAFIWVISSYFIGRFWYKHNWVLAEAEVGNRYNLFQKEMRRKIKLYK